MSFSDEIRAGVDGIKQDNEKIVKLAAIELFTQVIRGTPVGNPDRWQSPAPKRYTGGSARNNWFLSFKAPSSKDDRAPSESGSSSLGQLRRLNRVTSDRYILTNNLPYIERLENGWSEQAPAGMLRKNAKNWPNIVNAISAKVIK